MKLLLPVSLLVTGALLMAIPRWIFPVCLYAGVMDPPIALRMHCTLTGNITQWLGAVTIVSAIAYVFSSSRGYRSCALVTAALAATGTLFIYLARPGVCQSISMPCRPGTLPAAMLLATVQALLVATGLWKERNNSAGALRD